jgi:hypothetical protein
MTESDLTQEILRTAERKERIAWHIHQARRHICLMAVSMVTIELALLSYGAEWAGFALALAAFLSGYSLRSIISHIRRSHPRLRRS